MTYVGAIRAAERNKHEGSPNLRHPNVWTLILTLTLTLTTTLLGADKLLNDAKAQYVQALLDSRNKEEELYADGKDSDADSDPDPDRNPNPDPDWRTR